MTLLAALALVACSHPADPYPTYDRERCIPIEFCWSVFRHTLVNEPPCVCPEVR